MNALRAARSWALLAAVVLLPAAAEAQPRREDPDWPCVQRLVPHLSAAALWPGLPADATEAWSGEPPVADAVARAAPRSVDEAAGLAICAASLPRCRPTPRPGHDCRRSPSPGCWPKPIASATC